MNSTLVQAYPVSDQVTITTPQYDCPPGDHCYVTDTCGYEYCTPDLVPRCPEGYYLSAETGGCEVLPLPDPRRWYFGSPCDRSIYWYDNLGLDRGPDGLPTNFPLPHWQYVSYPGGPAGYLTGTSGIGEILMPQALPPWYFRERANICNSMPTPICWYQHVLYNIGIVGILWQSVIIRTPGNLGENPPEPPPAPNILFPPQGPLIPPIILNEFYTMGSCP